MDLGIRHVKRISEAEALLREVMNRPRPSHGSLELYDRISAFLRAAPEPKQSKPQWSLSEVAFLPKTPDDKKNFLNDVVAYCHRLGPALRDGVINPHQLRLGACLACQILSTRAAAARPLVEAQQVVIEAARRMIAAEEHDGRTDKVYAAWHELREAIDGLREVEGG